MSEVHETPQGLREPEMREEVATPKQLSVSICLLKYLVKEWDQA